MKVKTLLISTAAFVITFGIGLGGTLLLRDLVGKTGNHSDAYAQSLSGTSSSPAHDEELSPDPDNRTTPGHEHSPGQPMPGPNPADNNNIKVKNSNVPVITGIDGPEFHVIKRTYSVKVHAEILSGGNPSKEYILYDDSGTELKSGTSPNLTLEQCESGIYFVAVRNTVTQDVSDKYEIRGCRIQKMSAKRLEQICNSGDYTTMRNIEAYELSPEIELSFEGIPDDNKAASIDDICTRISFGIWKSVSISEIRYNDLNLVEYVKFRVVI